jgi:hypothetical protein
MPGLPLGNATTDTQNDSQRFVCRLSRGRQRDGRSRETDEDDLCLSDLSVIYLSLFFFIFFLFYQMMTISLLLLSKGAGANRNSSLPGQHIRHKKRKKLFFQLVGGKDAKLQLRQPGKNLHHPPTTTNQTTKTSSHQI